MSVCMYVRPASRPSDEVWVFPAVYRMIFQNSMRHTTASAFSALAAPLAMPLDSWRH